MFAGFQKLKTTFYWPLGSGQVGSGIIWLPPTLVSTCTTWSMYKQVAVAIWRQKHCRVICMHLIKQRTLRGILWTTGLEVRALRGWDWSPRICSYWVITNKWMCCVTLPAIGKSFINKKCSVGCDLHLPQSDPLLGKSKFTESGIQIFYQAFLGNTDPHLTRTAATMNQFHFSKDLLKENHLCSEQLRFLHDSWPRKYTSRNLRSILPHQRISHVYTVHLPIASFTTNESCAISSRITCHLGTYSQERQRS